MSHSELVLDKIVKQSQFFGLITNAETRAIPLSELVEDMKTYYAFTEVLWELYLKSSALECASNLLILQQRAEIQELKKEVEKLNKILNDN